MINTLTVYLATRILVTIALLLPAVPALAQSPAPETCSIPAAPATTPSSEFTILGDGSSIRHEVTELEWQRCSIGQSWDGATCQGSPTSHDWQMALDTAASAGGDWRLPNIQELRSIVEHCRRSPAINRQAFPNTPAIDFWSASPVARDAAYVWRGGFNFGSDKQSRKTRGGGVRLVRSVQ